MTPIAGNVIVAEWDELYALYAWIQLTVLVLNRKKSTQNAWPVLSAMHVIALQGIFHLTPLDESD